MSPSAVYADEVKPAKKTTASSTCAPAPSHAGPTREVSSTSATAALLWAAWSVLLLPLYSLLWALRIPLRKLLLSMLSLGPIPRHMAFIMDGNRRWANSQKIPLPVRQGHISGFGALKTVLEVCLELKGLDTVSVYAFAIDNFKRDPEEVEALMTLAKRNLKELAGHGEVLARHSVRLRIVGRRELLPADVRTAVESVERMTLGNKRATLNVCIPYASRDEMAGAVRCLVHDSLSATSPGEQLEKDRLKEMSSEEALQDRMLLRHSPPVDVMVRTSGVRRLSDFMLWQSCDQTHLHFTARYWPLFGLRELVPIILDYQRAEWRRRLMHWAS